MLPAILDQVLPLPLLPTGHRGRDHSVPFPGMIAVLWQSALFSLSHPLCMAPQEKGTAAWLAAEWGDRAVGTQAGSSDAS